jgi:hypothetical protein
MIGWQAGLTYVVVMAACVLLVFRLGWNVQALLEQQGAAPSLARRAVWKFRLGSILLLTILVVIRVLLEIHWISAIAAAVLVFGVAAVAAIAWGNFQVRIRNGNNRH